VHLTSTLGWPRSCALALALISGPSAALAQAPAQGPATPPLTFPTSLEHGVLADWLRRETDLPPGAVVAISPLAVVAIVQTRPMASPEGFEVSVRAETIDAGFSRQEGIASWNATMKLACADRTFSMGEVTAHAARNLKGETKPIQTALAGWNPVTPGTMQGQIWSARCGGDFTPPLAEPSRPAAQAAPSPPVAAPPRPEPAPAASPKPNPAPTVAAPPRHETVAPPAAAPKPPSPATKPTPKPSGPARPSSAQVLSAPSSDEAARALTRLKTRFASEMSGLSTSIVPVLADGKPRYRAVVSGFHDPAEAMAFCAKITAAGGKCLARADAGRAASEKAP
jgi:hypothetical protein